MLSPTRADPRRPRVQDVPERRDELRRGHHRARRAHEELIGHGD